MFRIILVLALPFVAFAGPRPPQAPDPADLRRLCGGCPTCGPKCDCAACDCDAKSWSSSCGAAPKTRRNVPCEVQGQPEQSAPYVDPTPPETTAQRLARLLSVRVAINYNGQFLRWGTLGEYLSLGGSLDAYRANGAISDTDLSFLRYYYSGATAAPVVHPVAQPMPVMYSPPVYYSTPTYYGGACLTGR